MIRTVPIPRVARMGMVFAGQGGSATVYNFTDGLSNDPRLAPYLQNLTADQLQGALDNTDDPTANLLSLLDQSATATGAGTLPCGDPSSGDPNCTGGAPLSAFNALGILGTVPSWVWLICGGAVLLGATRR